MFFSNWSIHSPTLCVFWFKDTLFTIYCWFANIELTANSAIALARRKLIQRTYFLQKAHNSLLASETLDSTAALCLGTILFYFIFSFIFISWRLITLQHCSGFCHTLKWISHGFTCIPHPGPPSHLPLQMVMITLYAKQKRKGIF